MQALGLVWSDVNDAIGFQETITVMREASHFDARYLIEVWQKWCADGGFVIGRHVPSRELAAVMSHLVVYEPLDGGADFRARLAGAALMRRFGRDISGSRLSELFAQEAFAARRDDLQMILRLQTPCVLEGRVTVDNYPMLHFEIVALPVLAPDEKTPWILAGLFYHDWPAHFGPAMPVLRKSLRRRLFAGLLPRVVVRDGVRARDFARPPLSA